MAIHDRNILGGLAERSLRPSEPSAVSGSSGAASLRAKAREHRPRREKLLLEVRAQRILGAERA
jgi:hypothetical protein